MIKPIFINMIYYFKVEVNLFEVKSFTEQYDRFFSEYCACQVGNLVLLPYGYR